jgi:hypothetical protein
MIVVSEHNNLARSRKISQRLEDAASPHMSYSRKWCTGGIVMMS